MKALRTAGFPGEQTAKARCFTLWTMSVASDVSCSHVCQAGFSKEELEEGGFVAKEIREVSEAPHPVCAEDLF